MNKIRKEGLEKLTRLMKDEIGEFSDLEWDIQDYEENHYTVNIWHDCDPENETFLSFKYATKPNPNSESGEYTIFMCSNSEWKIVDSKTNDIKSEIILSWPF